MKLRIGHLSTIYHTSLLIQGMDLLSKMGIEASWRLFGGGPAIVNAMKNDEIDIGYIGLPPAMIGMAEGADITCVAGGHIEGTVLSTKDPGLLGDKKSLMDSLESMRIASPPRGSIHDIILRDLLDRFTLKADVVNYPWADFIPLAIENGEIDAAIGTPALAVYLKNFLGMKIPLPPHSIWPFNPSYGIISRCELLDTGLLRTFIEAHEQACNILIQDPSTAANIVSRLNGFIDSKLALEIIGLSPKYCAHLPDEYVDSTLRFLPVMKKQGYMTEILSKKDIFNIKLINEIHNDPHHYNKPLEL